MRLNWLTLPFTALTTLQDSGIWNIQKIGFGKDNKNHQILEDGSLKVFYPKGSYSPSKFPQGGIGFYSSPEDIFPAEDVMLTYQVKFDDTFNPVLGGKLPGLFLSEGVGKEYMKDASDGSTSNSTASIRIVWRKDFAGEAYVYAPNEQDEEYQNIPNLIKNDAYGDSLWRGLLQFQPNEWNYVCIRIKLNSFDDDGTPNKNGIIEVKINDARYKFTKFVWRTNPDTRLTAIMFSTFFGGSSSKYATPVDTWTYFNNMRIQKFN
jgi:hypothetical protein